MSSEYESSTRKVSLNDAIFHVNSFITMLKDATGFFRSYDDDGADWCLKTAEESPYVAFYENYYSQIVRAAQAIRECQQRGEAEIDPALCRIEV